MSGVLGIVAGGKPGPLYGGDIVLTSLSVDLRNGPDYVSWTAEGSGRFVRHESRARAVVARVLCRALTRVLGVS